MEVPHLTYSFNKLIEDASISSALQNILIGRKKKKQQRQLDNFPEISGMRSGNALDLRDQLETPEGSEVNGRSASVSVRTRAFRKRKQNTKTSTVN